MKEAIASFIGFLVGVICWWSFTSMFFYPTVNSQYCAAMQFVAKDPVVIFWSRDVATCYIELTPGVMVPVLDARWPK